MKRILTVLAVAALMAATAMPAFANPNRPGPNSLAPNYSGSGENFGHCQSQGKPSGGGSSASIFNPAIYQGQTNLNVEAACPKQ